MKNILDTKAGAAAALGITAILAVYLFKKSIAQGASDAAYSIAPTNPNNIFSNGVNSVGKTLSGNEHWSLGGWIYDVSHSPDEFWQGLPEK
ncbi:hypothetical protein NBRC116592_13020 [Colwellia sp. KU-HH00111]|uniref:hypothetical protein n=1 Tax=Colwellia sp. KU-HH00111 TaxID=3127652 RepID=UPI003109A4CC